MDKFFSQIHLLSRSPKSLKENYKSLQELGIPNDKIALHVQLLSKDPRLIRENYKSLQELGIPKNKVALHSQLLGKSFESVKRNYDFLVELGLKNDRIVSRASLLGMDPDAILKKYRYLIGLGLKEKKIASRVELLELESKTIERNYLALSKLGLSNKSIASNAPLLGRDPKTIRNNYQFCVGLLRQDFEDGDSGRKTLLTYAQLLGISRDTILSNIQYLHSFGVDYNDGFLLGTTPRLKREKMAWLLREVFDYKGSGDKKATIHRMYDFVRDNPKYLVKSINTLNKEKDKIRKKVQPYSS